MTIQIAKHYGMCFGVRDALKATHEAAKSSTVTVLGQLVHNPVVQEQLRSLGVHQGELSATPGASTKDVIITAHGAADHQRETLRAAGHRITDTTCPLVRKAHEALRTLVESGYQPIVIGQASHVEVRGLTGDFPQSRVILSESDLDDIPFHPRFGLISQTTQPLATVLHLVDALKRRHPEAEVRFVDTVCHPTKQRQTSLEELCATCDMIIVVGGRNSNNTHQLVETATRLGVSARQVERADDLDPTWFCAVKNVGVTAGTSTLDETVQGVVTALQGMSAAA